MCDHGDRTQTQCAFTDCEELACHACKTQAAFDAGLEYKLEKAAAQFCVDCLGERAEEEPELFTQLCSNCKSCANVEHVACKTCEVTANLCHICEDPRQTYECESCQPEVLSLYLSFSPFSLSSFPLRDIPLPSFLFSFFFSCCSCCRVLFSEKRENRREREREITFNPLKTASS
jgi:hypothetical protein